jgi:hypothetical protein
MPAAGARSWSRYISCADGGCIKPRMKGVGTAPPACEAVSLKGSRAGLGAAESDDPCRASILPVIGLLSPRARCAAHDDQLPSHKGSAHIATLFQYVLANSYDSNPTGTAGGTRTVPYPAVLFIQPASVRLEWPVGMKPTPIRRRTANRRPAKAELPKSTRIGRHRRGLCRATAAIPCRSEEHPVCRDATQLHQQAFKLHHCLDITPPGDAT